MSAAVTSRAERKTAQRERLRAALPEPQALETGLRAILGDDVVVVQRWANDYASSFPSEIVGCRTGDGRELQLLVKFGVGQGHRSHGHRGDAAHESEVYRRVLLPSRCSAPRWHGTYLVPGTEDRWLAIEYVVGAERVACASRPAEAMTLAARWSGEFHALNEPRAAGDELAFMPRYDAEYYGQWAQRTVELSAELQGRFPWLASLCARFVESLEPLLAAPTVIHGEYTPKNTLIQRERVCPVDWESAAIAAGEIDLAALTDEWPPPIAERCVLEYRRARWPRGAPADFARRLALARLYWNFRWLGERAEWTTSERGQRRIENVARIAKEAGLFHD